MKKGGENSLKSLIISVVQSSLLGTIVFAFLLLLKRIAQKRCGAKVWHHFIMINIVLYVMPIVLLNQMLYSYAQPLYEWIHINMLRISDYQPNAIIYRNVLSSEQLFIVLFWIWLTGASMYFIIRGLRNSLSTYRLHQGLQPASVYVCEVFNGRLLSDKGLNRFGRLRHVKLYLHEKLCTPVFFGFWHKNIVFPMKLIDKYDQDDVYLMLRHEVMHMIHSDSWKRFFMLLVQAIHWFNPLLLLMGNNVNEAIEIYCDHDTITDKSNRQLRYKYSDLLISMIDNNHQFDSTGFSLSNNNIIAKRLTFTMQKPKKPEKVITASIALFICVIVFFCLCGFGELNSCAIIGAPIGVITDIGESTQYLPRLPPASSISTHNLSAQGTYAYEQRLYQNTINYSPIAFVTKSTGMCINLLSRDCADTILVYLYNSADKNNPLLQTVLKLDSDAERFSGLSGEYSYYLGFIIEQNVDTPAKFLISD